VPRVWIEVEESEAAEELSLSFFESFKGHNKGTEYANSKQPS